MSFIHDFRGVVPYERSDGIAYTRAVVEESEAAAGEFTEIEALAIDPDPTPEDATPVDLTVTAATLERGWFRFRFDTGDATPTSPYTPAVFSPAPGSSPVDLEELKDHLDKELDADDDLLGRFLAAALLQAQAPPPNGCGRLLTPDPAIGITDPITRDPVRLRGARRRVIVPDAREISAVTVDGVEVDWDVGLERDGHIVLIEVPAPADPTDPTVRRECELTGLFGFETIPENLRNGIYVLAARAFHERDAAYADQVAIAEGAGVQTYYRQLPPATKLAFATYSLPSGLAGLS